MAWIRRATAVGLMLAVGASWAAVRPLAGQEVIDLPGDDRALTADFEEVFRIGSLDGDEWETFGEIAEVAFDGAGNLYVLDRQASRITMVDRQGRFVREIGQQGEGPGEFRMPMSLAVMRDGRLVVADIGHRAYQLFSADGTFERMVSMGGDEGFMQMGAIAPDPSGSAVIAGGGGGVVMSRTGPGEQPALPTTRPVERVSLTGDRAQPTTIAEGWMPPRGDPPTTLEGGGMRFQMSVAGPRTFEPALLVGALPDGGVAFADSTTYAVKVAGGEGGVRRVLRRPFRPRPVDERMQEAEKERRLAELEAGEGPQMRVMVQGPGGGGAQAVSQDAIREMMRGQIEQMRFYPELPVLRGLRTSWTGRIWAQRRGEQPTEPGPIDVLTAQGSYVGTLASESTAMPDAFGPDGFAAFVEEDDLGVPLIVVRRLPATIN